MTGNFAAAMTPLVEDMEYQMYLQLSRPSLLFHLIDPDYEPLPVLTREEWDTNRRQLHPTAADLRRLLPEQIYLYPGNYDWWCLPEEDEPERDW